MMIRGGGVRGAWCGGSYKCSHSSTGGRHKYADIILEVWKRMTDDEAGGRREKAPIEL